METARIRPGNFLLGNVRDLERGFAYFPFLGGPHQCLGRDFFLLQAQLVIIMAAQRYLLEVAPGHVARVEALITQRMRGPLPMVIQRR